MPDQIQKSSVVYKVKGKQQVLGMPEGDIAKWKANMEQAFGDQFQVVKIQNSSPAFQNGCSRAQEEIGNKLGEVGIENQQQEYMKLNGKQYTKYGKTWMLDKKVITNPALLADLEQEYVRQFKST